MMIQAVGMIFVIASTTLMGCYFAGKKRYRKEDLKGMAQALTLLKNQICFMNMPLPEAMMDIGEKLGGSIGAIFKSAGKMMDDRSGKAADEIWKEALYQTRGRLYYTSDDMEMLLAFGKTLGYLDVSQQQDSIMLLMDYLKGQQRQLQNDWNKHQRLCLSIGALSGLLLIVALL